MDYESCKDFYLVVEAKDGGTPALSAVTTVNVNVTDVNDNAPKFSQVVYSAVISEDAAVGDSVIMVSAMFRQDEAFCCLTFSKILLR